MTSPGILDKKFRGFTLLQVVFMYGEMSDVAAIYEYVVPSQDHDWEKFLVATDDKGRTAKGFVEEILSLWSSKKYKELNEWLYPDENWTAEDIQRYGGWISDLQEDLLPNYLLPQNEESDEAPDEEMTAGGEGGAAI